MRVDVGGSHDLIFLLQKYRPCPQCSSGRVTVQDTRSQSGAALLAVRCADCDFALDAEQRSAHAATTQVRADTGTGAG